MAESVGVSKAPRWARVRRWALAGSAGALVVAGTAVAVGVGFQNPSFESGFDGWVVRVDRPAGNGVPGDHQGKPNREVVYGSGGSLGPAVPCEPGDRYGICIVSGADSFTTDGLGRQVTVEPRFGSRMVRLGGPFTNPYQRQTESHRLMVEQTFTVDSQHPLLRLRYKLYTYDALHVDDRFGGYDRFGIEVLDRNGHLIDGRVRDTHFNHGEGRNLRGTRWSVVRLDLTPYVGSEVTLRASITGRRDRVGGSWAYVDATTNQPPLRTLSVTTTGSGTGQITGPGISCPPDCTESYTHLHRVELSGAPTGGSTLTGVSGSCALLPCRLVMKSDRSVTANFVAPVVSGPTDTVGPTTKIKGPSGKTKVKRPKRPIRLRFTFAASEPGSTFQCALDRRGFTPCPPRYRTPKLKLGRHKLAVRATDSAGNTGPPVQRSVKVVRAR